MVSKSVTIEVTKRSGENIVQINDQIKVLVKEMRGVLPPSLKINLTSDKSQDVRLHGIGFGK
jgi:multidrug efflux pump